MQKFPLHGFLNNSISPPFPDDCEVAYFAMGCFWGAERFFWQMPGVYSTAVGYAGGEVSSPGYYQVCSGKTGHTETVQVVFHTDETNYAALLKTFWESHNPTQGLRQGNDVGSQYRSAIFYTNQEQLKFAQTSKDQYQSSLSEQNLGEITTEISPLKDFWYAEHEHQQYLYRNPNGYCGLKGSGVSCNF
jgi:peptide-methionine (S)-S-oxide reductase